MLENQAERKVEEQVAVKQKIYWIMLLNNVNGEERRGL